MRSRAVEYFVISLALVGALFCVVSRTTGQLLNRPIRASGAWWSDFKGEGKWTASLAVEGNTITGTIEPEGWSGLSAGEVGEVTGRFSAGSIELGVIATGGLKADFAGALTESGIKGTYETTTGDRGQWEGTWEADAPLLASNEWPAGTVLIPPGEVSEETAPRRSSGRMWAIAHSRGQTLSSTSLTCNQDNDGPGTNGLVNNIADGCYMQVEPEIAVDWATPSRVVAGAMDNSLSDPPGDVRLAAYRSTNGGASWSGAVLIPGLSDYNAAADPSLDFDAQGEVFYAGVAFDVSEDDGCTMNCCDQAVVVARGDWVSGALTWNDAKVVSSVAAGDLRELDKPWLAVDKSPGSPYLNNVYVAFTQSSGSAGFLQCYYSSVLLKRSTDQGESFPGPPTVVSDDFYDRLAWPNVAVDPAGAVDVIWLDRYNMIMFDKCTNAGPSGGLSCGTDHPVAQIDRPDINLPGTTFTMSWIPSMAIDVRGTAPNGYIYIVWNDDRLLATPTPGPTPTPGGISDHNSDIYLTRSTDGGAQFSETPMRIASTPYDEFFPAIAVSSSHVVYVTYYRRTSLPCALPCSTPTTDTFNTYVIFSTDAGQTWSAPQMVNDGGDISPGGGNIGDYIGIDTGTSGQGPRINALWTDSRRQQQDIYSISVGGC